MEAVVIPLIYIVAYLLPTIVAAARSKDNLLAIAALNILLGWTLLGWVVSLVWALTKDRETVLQTKPKPGVVSVSESEARLSRARVWIAVVAVCAIFGFWLYQSGQVDPQPPSEQHSE